MLLDDLGPRIRVTEMLRKVDGRWALVSKHDPKKVLQYYHGNGHPSEEWVKKVERRVHSFESVIVEGGNAFKNPDGSPRTKQNASTAEVDATLIALGKRIGIDLISMKTGSTIYPNKITGDGDTMLDPADFIEVDPNASAKETQNRFREWLTSKLIGAGFKDTITLKKQSDGLTVEAPIPDSDETLQIDLDISEPSDGKFARWARRGEPGDQAKGAFRHILKSAIARAINPNWKWSYKNSLFDEESGKTLTKDPDEIAKLMFGKTAKASDLDNIQTILAKLKQTRPGIYQAVVDKANEGIANMKYNYRLGQ